MARVAFLESLGPGRMDFRLSRTIDLMRRLGDPQCAFSAVHVAGTNGKGSVSAMVAASLRKSGLRTGLYTSPHLERLNERFQINGSEITDSDLGRLSARLERQTRNRVIPRPTQFEALTALAFLWFAERRVDIAVVEVGLGGRLDATNALTHVAASVITNIGADHTAWLGTTPAAIATEKAGIIRPRVPVITAATEVALDVIRRKAAGVAAPLVVVSEPYSGPVGLGGPHQLMNAAVAAATLRRLPALGFPVSDADSRAGIASATWPGRLERFTLKAGHNSITVVLDGAHNAPAAQMLAASLKDVRPSRLTLVFGVLRDKDAGRISRTLAPLADRVVTVTAPSNRAVPASALARLPAWREKARASTLLGALKSAVMNGRDGDTVLVTGSLYLIGAARGMILSSHFVSERSPRA